MRRIAISLGLAGLVAALAVTPALAAQSNVYTVTAKVTPAKGGTKAKPAKVGVKFAYTVGEKSGQQPAAVKQYTIGFGGLRDNGGKFATCSAAKMLAAGGDDVCPKGSLVGTGKIANYVYMSSDPSGAGGFSCAKDLKIYNSGKGKATLYINGPAATCGGVGALPPVAAKFVPFAGGGTALRFALPPTILHPMTGLTVAVRSVESTLKKGYLTSVGFKGAKRPVAVGFLTEDGQTTTVRTTAR
jgi:hypothetical protein